MNKIFLFFILLSCANSSSTNYLISNKRDVTEREENSSYTHNKKEQLILYSIEEEKQVRLFVNNLKDAKSYSLFHSNEENLVDNLILKIKACELLNKSQDVVFYPQLKETTNFYKVKAKLKSGEEIYSNILKKEFSDSFSSNSLEHISKLNFDNLSDFDSREGIPTLPPAPSKTEGYISENEFLSQDFAKLDVNILGENLKFDKNNELSLENSSLKNSFENKEESVQEEALSIFSRNGETFLVSKKENKKGLKKEQKEKLKEEEELKRLVKKENRVFLKRKNSVLKLVKISEKLISSIDEKKYLEEKNNFLQKLKTIKQNGFEKLNEIEYLKSYKRLKILNIQVKKYLKCFIN